MTSRLATKLLILSFSISQSLAFTTQQNVVTFSKLFSSRSNTNDENGNIDKSDHIINQKILNKLFNNDSPSSSMINLHFAGIGTMPDPQNKEKSERGKDDVYLFLTTSMNNPNQFSDSSYKFPAIPIPFVSSTSNSNKAAMMNLLKSAYERKLMSKTKCMTLGSYLINRQDGLFDSLPWYNWTISSPPSSQNTESSGDAKEDLSYTSKRDYDAAGNPIDPKYHYGKRDAYQRFMGKDWPGRSLSIGNLAQKILYIMEESSEDNIIEDKSQTFDKDTTEILAKRILELQEKEIKQDLAAVEEDYAVWKTSMQTTEPSSETSTDRGKQIEETLTTSLNRLKEIEEAKQALDGSLEGGNIGKSKNGLLGFLLKSIVDYSTDNRTNSAPYRGAYGYSPLIDSKEDYSSLTNSSPYPYTGPYELLDEIIQDQLNAQVLGLVLENTWILNDDTFAVGGACVIKRNREKKKIMIDGEQVELYDDDSSTLSKEKVQGGDVYIAECDADEAVGYALSLGSPIQIETALWERLNVQVQIQPVEEEMLPQIQIVDDEEVLNMKKISSLADTEEEEKKEKKNVQLQNSSIGPKTTASLFSFSSSDTQSSSSSFGDNNNTDDENKSTIGSLAQYDGLSDADKAKLYMNVILTQEQPPEVMRGGGGNAMNAVLKKLPRPRVLRQSPQILDELLLPYIDESVRRQFYIRQAYKNGDFELAQQLESQKSRRQILKERMEDNYLDENEKKQEMIMDQPYSSAEELDRAFREEQERLEKEVDFYTSLKADYTQNDGDYDRYLDKGKFFFKNVTSIKNCIRIVLLFCTNDNCVIIRRLV